MTEDVLSEPDSISLRLEKLEHAKEVLLQKFVGLDEVIHEFISQVRPWYLFPEELSRPIIINLWGMTGLGKTDIVKTFVDALELTHRFKNLSFSGGQPGNVRVESVADFLTQSELHSGEPGIVLFDEIQRFRGGLMREEKKRIRIHLQICGICFQTEHFRIPCARKT